ncbi:hypothetical protein EOD23_29465 [Mesorhizobium sp. USDA-HM6]|nr:hypothetical protein EOD23_29465 [Mesorhizobium sp. USDA-HM6]
MARLSPKHLLVMLLAVFLTAGFSLSATQASVMSATMTAGDGLTMPAGPGMDKMADAAMKGDCKGCLKGAGGDSKGIYCLPTCIAPAVAVLPQNLDMTTTRLPSQILPLPAPFLHGRSSLPDPHPPKPSALV